MLDFGQTQWTPRQTFDTTEASVWLEVWQAGELLDSSWNWRAPSG